MYLNLNSPLIYALPVFLSVVTGLLTHFLFRRHHPLASYDISFAKWFETNGGHIHDCLQHRPSGLFATCDILPGELLLATPDSLVLSAFKAGSEDGRMRTAMEKMRPPRNDNNPLTEDFNFILTTLALFLSLPHPPSDFFSPYINTLPLNDCHTPTCRTPEYNLHNHTITFEQALQTKRSSILNYYHLSGLASSVNQQDFLNAVSVVESRAWPPGLIPGIDLLNHDHVLGSPVKQLNGNLNVVTAKTHVSAGDEGEASEAKRASLLEDENTRDEVRLELHCGLCRGGRPPETPLLPLALGFPLAARLMNAARAAGWRAGERPSDDLQTASDDLQTGYHPLLS